MRATRLRQIEKPSIEEDCLQQPEYGFDQSPAWYSHCYTESALGVDQFVILKPLSYCFEETIGFDVKASFASRPESRLIR